MQDLAQYVNEVKRDNETLREIDQYQKSIENLVSGPFLLLVHLRAPSRRRCGSISLFFFCRIRRSVTTGDPKATGRCGWPRWTNEPNRTGEMSD